MRLVAYRSQGRARLGILVGDGGSFVPLEAAWRGSGALPVDLVDLIARHPGGDLASVLAVDATHATHATPTMALSSVTLTAPIPRPRRNVFCVGKNYREHAAEFGKSGYDAGSDTQAADHVPTKPVVFTKAPSTVIASGEAIDPHTDLTKELDYEAEIAVIIGRGGKRISRESALAHVWGYTLVNDVTARDLQRDHKQWFLGKSIDTFCPMGPWAVTADEVGDASLDLECRVNGELRQKASTRDLIFDIPTLLATISAGIALEPGDIIATGTPAGVGLGFEPPRFLRPGDVVAISSGQLGTLTNTIGGAT